MDERAIRRYWTDQALAHGTESAASWSDSGVIELEIEAIGSRLTPGCRVLDVGCANGFSSLHYAEMRGVELVGVDYVPEMIEAAEERLRKAPSALHSSVSFQVADVRELPFADASFDALVSTRVIINLPDRDAQTQGLMECVRIIRPGGLLLLSEATLQGWRRLNAFRDEWGLPPIPMPAFNSYLDVDAVVEELEPYVALVELVDFASSYYVATRVFKPLLATVAAPHVDAADPQAEFNRWASALPPAGDYGTQKLFVFRRR